MYELNRARLVAVGPRAARYTDVTLDLSGIGAPAEGARTLFGTTRRPSPTSLLVLENGGGKTVLLKLLFSVLLPGRRKVLGGGSNSMDRFVVDTDLGHVALEWMHVGTGHLLVTGKALQRRSKPVPAQSTVAEAWYSFRPGTHLTLETLPLAEEGRRRRLDGYRDALMELNRTEAGLQVNWAGDREMGQWTRHLRELGLEPDLFDIQRSMNVDEGDAANPFTFRTAAEFINWLLTTVTDPADARAVVDTFDQWAETLASRSAMLLERDFLDGAIAGLDPLADAHAASQTAKREAAAARVEATRLVVALRARSEREENEAAALGERLIAARNELASAETARDRGREVVNEIVRLTLLLELKSLRDAQLKNQGELRDAADHVEAWRVVPTVHACIAADAEAVETADLLRAKRSEAAPALVRRDRAAAGLLAALAADAGERETDAKRFTAEASDADADAILARQDAVTAIAEQGRLQERVESHQRLIRSTEAALAGAEAAGQVPADAALADLPRLVDEAFAEHDRLIGELAEARLTLESVRREAASRADAEKVLRGSHRDTAAAATSASTARQDADQAADRVAALPTLREFAGLGPGEDLALAEFDEHADRLVQQLQAGADAHQSALDKVRIEQEQDQRVLDALGDGGLLPARDTVADAVGKLSAAGVTAYAGWAYLAQAAPASDRSALIDAHPDLADGVVVLDPRNLELARDVLQLAQLLPAAAVTVGTGALLLNLTVPVADRFVIEPTPAMYDTEAADRRRDALASTMGVRAARIGDLVAQRDRLATTATQVRAWRVTSPPGTSLGSPTKSGARPTTPTVFAWNTRQPKRL